MRTTVRSRTVGVILAIAGVALASACGSDSNKASDNPTPSCMSSLARVAVPSDGSFPTDFCFTQPIFSAAPAPGSWVENSVQVTPLAE